MIDGLLVFSTFVDEPNAIQTVHPTVVTNTEGSANVSSPYISGGAIVQATTEAGGIAVGSEYFFFGRNEYGTFTASFVPGLIRCTRFTPGEASYCAENSFGEAPGSRQTSAPLRPSRLYLELRQAAEDPRVIPGW